MSRLPPSPGSGSVSAANPSTSTPSTPASLPSIQLRPGYAVAGRRTHKKSRTGCSTCKARKIKTHTTLAADSTLWEFWRDDVVQMGLACDYIMRAVLAVSALHLAYHRPDRRDFYTESGILLHQKAARSAMRVMAADHKIDKDQAANLFVFSMLTIASSTTASGEPGRPDHLLHTYTHAVDELELALVAQRDPAAPRDVLDAMVWLWEVSDSLVPLLRVPTQEAVAIFAHFCVLLKHHESHWWLQGWADHIMARAHEILDAEHREWIEWPIREIGRMGLPRTGPER
ncbi:uncharacterized protein THITE_2078336 [Thermothielavioides terrestris NRRL 8126]|uniref:Uncharacterized protein n=1 Tax=Thermothielavioides terrestris (strain ATCC 38088 / NRRL 8126) TaxID=578455 RepID=G2R5K1_THETT|nr:uncharacterized protein THITE_2078336 [Thermothielavioides terrestris NRRL 8126]AEO67492.1 hypothetical protein THITE_2078336 [Thermothielavioides terrestris NRRL 8126]